MKANHTELSARPENLAEGQTPQAREAAPKPKPAKPIKPCEAAGLLGLCKHPGMPKGPGAGGMWVGGSPIPTAQDQVPGLDAQVGHLRPSPLPCWALPSALPPHASWAAWPLPHVGLWSDCAGVRRPPTPGPPAQVQEAALCTVGMARGTAGSKERLRSPMSGFLT